MTRPSGALVEHRDRVIEILREHGVESAIVFGSVATGIDTEQWDLDIAVRFVDRPTGFAYFGALVALEEQLMRVLGIRVDVVERDQLWGATATNFIVELL